MQSASLNSLHPGRSALITSLQADIGLERRLFALGFRIGREVSMLRKASFSGPLHVRIGTTEVMLRRRDAHVIQVQTVSI